MSDVFISWSGEASRLLAEGIKDWIPHVLHSKVAFVSDSSLQAGEDWRERLREELNTAKCAVICVTPEAVSSPWLNFECGAIARNPDARVIPICLGIEPEQLPTNLSAKMTCRADKDGVKRLLHGLADALVDAPTSQVLDKAHNDNWTILEKAIENASMECFPPDSKCVEGFQCFVRQQSRGDNFWPPLLVTEIQEFLELENGENGKARVSSTVYARQAEDARTNEVNSLHVLYATQDALKNYYSQIHDSWVFSEAPPKKGCERRRLIVIEGAATGSPDYRALLVRVHEKLGNTSELRVVSDTELRLEHPGMLRDLGIFEVANQAPPLVGFAAFPQLATETLFSQSSDGKFVIKDQLYLANLTAKFDQCWNEIGPLKLGEELSIFLEQWKDELSPDVYRWANSEGSLNRSALEGLTRNEIPAIRIQDFATPTECEAFATAAQEVTRTSYPLESDDPPIEKVGTPLFECRHDDQEHYFALAAASRDTYSQIVEVAGWDPVLRMKSVLQRRCKIEAETASERGNDYFAGLIRFIEKGTLKHVDYAPSDAVGYHVDQVVNQVAWNLILKSPDGGGYCRVFDSLFCDEYDSCRISYGFTEATTAGSRYFDIEALVGDVVIFNCRNFHEVQESLGDRITVGSFLGQFPDETFVMWS